jgi:hypothetical protein
MPGIAIAVVRGKRKTDTQSVWMVEERRHFDILGMSIDLTSILLFWTFVFLFAIK